MHAIKMVSYIYHTVQIDCLQLCTFFYNCFLLQLFSSIENREKTGRRCGIGSARSGRKAAAAIRGPAPSPCVIAIPVHFPRCFPHVRSLPSTNQERLWTVKLVSIGGEGGGEELHTPYRSAESISLIFFTDDWWVFTVTFPTARIY